MAELSKYEQALAKYNCELDDQQVADAVKKIIAEKVHENDTLEVKKFLFGSIELTTLKTTDSDESVMAFTERVNQFDQQYAELPHVATICVYPCFGGDYETMCEDIHELKETCGENVAMKVILETGCLKTASNIKKASILSMYAGADYIKTSTGKEKISATPEAAYVMCQAIKEYYDETGIQIGFKPAGGINSVMDAMIYYTIVKEVLGEKWLTNKWFRLGTSRLANLLLSEIEGSETKFF